EAIVGGLLGDALRNGPRREHAVSLEAQVPVQARRRVLVDHEAPPLRASGARLGRPLRRRALARLTPLRLVAARLDGGREVAFGAVLLQARAWRLRTAAGLARAARRHLPLGGGAFAGRLLRRR